MKTWYYVLVEIFLVLVFILMNHLLLVLFIYLFIYLNASVAAHRIIGNRLNELNFKVTLKLKIKEKMCFRFRNG